MRCFLTTVNRRTLFPKETEVRIGKIGSRAVFSQNCCSEQMLGDHCFMETKIIFHQGRSDLTLKKHQDESLNSYVDQL